MPAIISDLAFLFFFSLTLLVIHVNIVNSRSFTVLLQTEHTLLIHSPDEQSRGFQRFAVIHDAAVMVSQVSLCALGQGLSRAHTHNGNCCCVSSGGLGTVTLLSEVVLPTHQQHKGILISPHLL